MLPHKLYPWGNITISMVKKNLLGISSMPPNSLTKFIKKKKKKKLLKMEQVSD